MQRVVCSKHLPWLMWLILVSFCHGVSTHTTLYFFGLQSRQFFQLHPNIRGMRQTSNRSPWEIRNGRSGLSLAVLDEFQMASGEPCSHLEVISCDRLHQNSEGFSFANIATVKELASLRSHGALVLIVKGYARKKVQALAFEPGRIVWSALSQFEILCKHRMSQGHVRSSTWLLIPPFSLRKLRVTRKSRSTKTQR